MRLNLSSLVIALFTASIALTACSKEKPAEPSTLTATAPAGEASNLTERNAIQRLQSTLEQNFKTAGIHVKIHEIKKVPDSDFYWVNLEEQGSLFTTSDGQYVLQGELVRLGGKQFVNIGEQFQSAINKQLLSQLKTQDLIIYPATTQKRHTIYVFTDVSCSYCQRFHHQIKDINNKGIEVRYIAWPRGKQLFPAMETIWCSDDRKKAFDQVMKGEELAPATCTNPVQAQFDLGQKMGVTGTPAIFTEDGRQIGGYLSVSDLEKALNVK